MYTHMKKLGLAFAMAGFIIAGSAPVQAQQQKERYRNKANDPVAKLPYYKKLRWADGLFREGSYFNAIDYYGQLRAEQPRNPYLMYQLAESQWFTRDYVPAAANYGEAYATAPKIYPEAIYKQALMLKMQGDYSQAVEKFNQFIADNPKTFKKLKKRAEREIEGCTMAMSSVNDPIPVTVANAGPNVNSAYTELSPLPLGDTALMFGTMRQNSPVEIDNRRKESYLSRLMISKKQPNVPQVDSFQWPLPFADGNFNEGRAHVGNGAYSPGGDRFYFTQCSENGDSLDVICKIYVTKFEGSRWTNATLLGEGINEDGSNTQPFVATLGKKEILFFSSNRKLQSRGGYDIWYSVIDPRNGTYRRPQNAGKSINTEGDEQTPYYDERVNKLYFASNGWVTMGGFDIFSADGGPSRYQNLTNLGYPINTSADELYFIKDPLGKPDAYVVSNRIGSIALKNPTCCDDIWRIQYEPKLMAVGKVIDRRDGKMVTDVAVKIVDESGKQRVYNSTDGNFSFATPRGHTYVITGDKAGLSSTRATVSTVDVKRTDEDGTVNVTVLMDGINSGFRVSNVYYDFDKASLRPESVASLDSLVAFMKDNPALFVDIYSHADAKGDPKYNKELSRKRAESVMQYLLRNNIPAERMVAKGFGEAVPAQPNQVDGEDYPAGRQANRRTEFRIVSEVAGKRVLYNSSKPGSIDEQARNLKINENANEDATDAADSESTSGTPGSRVNPN
jgi:outer membrane protein OmpA-like peptidoglycan-associated protein